MWWQVTNLPYPGIITGIEEQNLESVRFKNPVTLIRFKFQYDMVPKQIAILPVNSVVRALQPVFIEEQFDQDTQDLRAGTDIDDMAFGMWELRVETIATELSSGMGTYIMKPTTRSTPVIITVHRELSTSTIGSGWGFFEYINLNLIQEF